MLPLALAMLVAFLAPQRGKSDDRDGFAEDNHGFIQLNIITSLVGAILVGLIVLLVINNLAPQLFTAVADLTGTLTTADLNSTVANAFIHVIAFIVPIAFVLSFIAIPFAAFELMRKGFTGATSSGY